jgi:hypothetical protein
VFAFSIITQYLVYGTRKLKKLPLVIRRDRIEQKVENN